MAGMHEVYMVAAVSFDVEQGPVLMYQCGPDDATSAFTSATNIGPEILNMMLPQSGNNVSEDDVLIVAREASATAKPRKNARPREVVFGCGAVCRVDDPSAPRGSITRSVAVFTRTPIFQQASGMMRDCARALSHGQVTAEALCEDLKVFVRDMCIQGRAGSLPSLPMYGPYSWDVRRDESIHKQLTRHTELNAFITKHRDTAMYLWRALLQHRTVLLYASTAARAAHAVILCLTLASPMRLPLEKLILHTDTPTHLDNKMEYVAGTTNKFMLEKRVHADFILDVETGKHYTRPTVFQQVQPTSQDMVFVNQVVRDLATNDEEWLRIAFQKRTTDFLDDRTPKPAGPASRYTPEQLAQRRKQRMFLAIGLGVVIGVLLFVWALAS